MRDSSSDSLLARNGWVSRTASSIRACFTGDTRVVLVDAPAGFSAHLLLDRLAQDPTDLQVFDTRGATEDWPPSLPNLNDAVPALVLVDLPLTTGTTSRVQDLLDLAESNRSVQIVASSTGADLNALLTLVISRWGRRFDLSQRGLTEGEILELAAAAGTVLPPEVVASLAEFSGWPALVTKTVSESPNGVLHRGLEAQQRSVSRYPLELAGSRLAGQLLTGVALCPELGLSEFAQILNVPGERLRDEANKLLTLGLLQSNPRHPDERLLIPVGLRSGLRRAASLQWSEIERDALHEACARTRSTSARAAAAMYLDLDDFSALDGVLRECFTDFLYGSLDGSGYVGPARIIAELPLASLRKSPMVLAFKIKASMIDGSLPSFDQIAAAEQILDSTPPSLTDQNGQDAATLTAQLIAASTLGDWPLIRSLIQEVDATLASLGSKISEVRGDIRCSLATEAALAAIDSGLAGAAAGLFAIALDTIRMNPAHRAHLLQQRALRDAFVFNQEAARNALSEAEALLRSEQSGVPDLFWNSRNTAVALLAVMDANGAETERAQGAIAQNLPHIERLDSPALFLLAGSSLVRLTEGGAAAARWLDLLISRPDVAARLASFPSDMLRALQASFAMFEEEYAEAQRILNQAPNPQSPPIIQARANLSLLQGKPLETLRQLWDAGPIFSPEVPGNRIPLLGAIALLQTEEVDEAKRWFKQSVRTSPPASVFLDMATVPYEPLLRLASLVRDDGGPDVVDVVESLPPNYRVSTHEPLSAAEQLVADQVMTGGTLNEIADALFISRNTVKTHLRSIYRKLNVSTRQEMRTVYPQLYPR